MGIMDAFKLSLQSALGKALDGITEDIKIESYHGFNITMSEGKIIIPSIVIESDPNFKFKVLDKKGQPVSDMPIPFKIEIQSQELIIIPAQIIKYIPDIKIKINKTN